MKDQPQSSPGEAGFADFKPELTAPGATPERLAHLKEHGFVIINDFVGSPWIPVLREAGRRVTEAVRPEHGYSRIDSSKGYVHRAREEEPWAIRGLIHPAFGEPDFAKFHGSPEALAFAASWCHGLSPEDMALGGMLLWCNPRGYENKLGWHRDADLVGDGEGLPRAAGGPRGHPGRLLGGGGENPLGGDPRRQRQIHRGAGRRQHVPGAGRRRGPRARARKP